MLAYMQICLHICRHAHMYAYMRAYMHIWSHICAYMNSGLKAGMLQKTSKNNWFTSFPQKTQSSKTPGCVLIVLASRRMPCGAPLLSLAPLSVVGFIFSFLRLRLLPGITRHRSRCENTNIRGHKQNQEKQEAIRTARRLIITAAPSDCGISSRKV